MYQMLILFHLICQLILCDNVAGQSYGNVRLVGSGKPYEGRVEFYNGNTWGTICDFFWDLNDAHVVCRQLGYSSAISTATVGGGTGPINLFNVHCDGDEDRLTECSSDSNVAFFCSHSDDVGVTCADEDKLTESSRSDRSADGGVIAGIVIGVLSLCILCCVCYGVCISCAVHMSKKKKTTSGVYYLNTGGPQPTTVYTLPTATGPSVNPPSFNPYVPPATSAPQPTAYTGPYPPNTAGYPPPANITAPPVVTGDAPPAYPGQPEDLKYC